VTTGTSPGNDINLGPHRLEAGRNFANKMWNAARFIFQSLESNPLESEALSKITEKKSKPPEDRWILSRLNRLILSVEDLMSGFQFGEAERQIHDFFWAEFCDWYIEIAKIRMARSDFSPLPMLAFTLDAALRLLHPFMPFITEELWQGLKQRLPEGSLDSPSIIIASYPTGNENLIDAEAEVVMDTVIEIIRSIRNSRAEHRVEAGKWIEARVYTDRLQSAISEKSDAIETLAKARPLAILNRTQRQVKEENALVLVLKEAEVVLPWAGMVDMVAERDRLEGEIGTLGNQIERLEQRLKDKAFVAKAPAAVVDKEREKLQSFKDKLLRLKQELTQLG
jgi:valyl-tRNA synthetase